MRPSLESSRAARSARAAAAAMLASAVGLLAGCEEGCGGAARAPDAGLDGAAAAPSSRGPSPRLSDERWKRALRDEDPVARAAFADEVGAAELAEALSDDEPLRGLALDALPHATDAELSMGALAILLDRTEGPARDEVLEVILAVAARPPAVGEILDPEGSRACADRVLALAESGQSAPRTRALAVSAAHRLADRGWIDRRSIPQDVP